MPKKTGPRNARPNAFLSGLSIRTGCVSEGARDASVGSSDTAAAELRASAAPTAAGEVAEGAVASDLAGAGLADGNGGTGARASERGGQGQFSPIAATQVLSPRSPVPAISCARRLRCPRSFWPSSSGCEATS
jgi:hypothetical protein